MSPPDMELFKNAEHQLEILTELLLPSQRNVLHDDITEIHNRLYKIFILNRNIGNLIDESQKIVKNIEAETSYIGKNVPQDWKDAQRGRRQMLKNDLHECGVEIEAITEAVYWNSARFIKLSKNIPGMKRFEIPNITLVRNILMEHPEHEKKKQPVRWGVLVIDDDDGPIIKGLRYGNQMGYNEDVGVFKNTKELLYKFIEKINLAIKDFPERE